MKDPKALVSVLAAPFRIFLMASFLLLAKMGLFTSLTPQNYHEVVNSIMDFLVVAAPAAYMIWAGIEAWRANKPEAIVAKAAALPEVARIIATPDIVNKLDDPTVSTR